MATCHSCGEPRVAMRYLLLTDGEGQGDTWVETRLCPDCVRAARRAYSGDTLEVVGPLREQDTQGDERALHTVLVARPLPDEESDYNARAAAHDRGDWEGCYCYECQCYLHAAGIIDMDREG